MYQRISNNNITCKESVSIWNTNASRREQSSQTPAHHRQPPTHTPPCHRIPSALPPSPSTLPFFLSFFFLHLPLYIAAAGGALLLLPWKGREGQAFTSPLPPAIISLICTPPLPPYLCSSYYLPPSSCLWHTAIGLESSEWGKARAELTHDSELLTLQLREPSAMGWLLAWTSSQSVLLIITLDSYCSFALPQAGTPRLKERERNSDSILGFHSLVSLKVVRFLCLWLRRCCLAGLELSMSPLRLTTAKRKRHKNTLKEAEIRLMDGAYLKWHVVSFSL